MTLALEPVVIGVGGNVGTQDELVARFASARDAIAELGRVRAAPLYRSAAIGPTQARFLNTALTLTSSDLLPRALLATLHELEALLGRRRADEARWGPRPIDLDILVWGDRTIRTPELEVPHPRLGDRRFALAPLADLHPELVVPGLGPVCDALARVASQDVELVAERW